MCSISAILTALAVIISDAGMEAHVFISPNLVPCEVMIGLNVVKC